MMKERKEKELLKEKNKPSTTGKKFKRNIIRDAIQHEPVAIKQTRLLNKLDPYRTTWVPLLDMSQTKSESRKVSRRDKMRKTPRK